MLICHKTQTNYQILMRMDKDNIQTHKQMWADLAGTVKYSDWISIEW